MPIWPYYLLGTLVTLALTVTTVRGALRWRSLDRGTRLVVVGVAVFTAAAYVALVLATLGQRTRIVYEGSKLFGTVLIVVGLSRWQPRPAQRRAVAVLAIVFAVCWAAAQWLQGVDADFSTVSGPLHAMALSVAAGITLVTQVRVSAERWTEQVWFWTSVGLMTVYGTEVVFDPFMAGVFQIRADLVALAFYFHQFASAIGWGLVAIGVWRATPIGQRGIEPMPWPRMA